MNDNEIAELEQQIHEQIKKLNELRSTHRGEKVRNYRFATLEGNTTLLDLFCDQTRLLVIHNMG